MSEAARSLPNDHYAEQCVLGAALMDAGAALRAVMICRPEHFHYEAHRTIFAAIEAVHKRGEPVDEATVGAELHRLGQLQDCGGAEYLMALPFQTPTPGHVVRYSYIVREKATVRQVARLGGEITAAAMDDPEDVEGLLTWLGSAVLDLTREAQPKHGTRRVGEDIGRLGEDLRRALTEEPFTTPARTGMTLFDKFTGGLGRQRVIIVRAPTKGFKSVFGLQCVAASARQFAERDPRPVVLAYVLEDIQTWIERLAAWLGDFDSSSFEPAREGGPWVGERLEAALGEMADLPLYYTGDLRDVDAIALDARRRAQEGRVGLVLIDHVQRLQGGEGDNITVRAEYQAAQLQALADELACPIVAPSQVTTRDGERIAKWSRAWDEAASLVLDLERGLPGMKREEWQQSRVGRFVLHASRRRSPFEVHDFMVDLPSGRMSDDPEEVRRARIREGAQS